MSEDEVREAEAPAPGPGAPDLPQGDSPTYEATYERSVRATALGRGTHGVPELRRLVEDAFSTAFPRRLWVAGQLGRVQRVTNGELHFRLRASVEQEPFVLACHVLPDTVPQLAEVLDRVHDAELDDVLLEGRLARVGGVLRFDVPSGGPVLFVSALDTVPTARGLAHERAARLQVVRDRGLPEHQQRRRVRTAPLRVALTGGAGDPALARARQQLEASGFGLELRDVAVPVHGPGAAAQLAGALREAALRSDVVLLGREQGRPLGLGLFDAPEVAQAVADAQVPVLSALGGGGETTVCDEVAFASLPSADDAARWVLSRLTDAEDRLRGLRDEVGERVRAASARAREDLEEAAAAAQDAGEAAQERADAAYAAQRRRSFVVAGVLAVALVAAAFLLGAPLVLVGLAVVVAGLLAALRWSNRAPRRELLMSAQDDDFAQVLERLEQVRDELDHTSSPEAVRQLREQSAQLVARGEAILGRDLEPVPAPARLAELPHGGIESDSQGGDRTQALDLRDAAPLPYPEAPPADRPAGGSVQVLPQSTLTSG